MPTPARRAAVVAAVAALALAAACDAGRSRDTAPADSVSARGPDPAAARATTTTGAATAGPAYAGACDVSAVVPAAPGVVLVASDEDDVIRAYRLGEGGAPLAAFDLRATLRRPGARGEADLEGGARVGDTIYWIGSQSRDRRGAAAPNRQQLVATTIDTAGGRLSLAPLGAPYRGLLDALTTAPALRRFGLAAAATRAAEAPGGLNVEGLAATPDGHLLLGFRNPVPGGRALVVPLENPGELVRANPAPPRLGVPRTLDLGGLGIRAMAYWPARGVYVLSAGASGDSSVFRLYTWDGGDASPALLADVGALGLTPEAIAVPDTGNPGRLALLSDDGDHTVGGRRCKDLADAGLGAQMRFRSAWVTVR